MKVYVGTYRKYNSGSIFGGWFDLSDFSDRSDFIDACLELHQDEKEPELMFQDWEEIPDGLITESTIDPALWEIMEEADMEAVIAYIKCFGEWDRDAFHELYRGKWNSWEDMVYDLLEGTGELNGLPEYLRSYFDYEGFAESMRLARDMVEEDGHFFWND